jgi:predicted  nucleic acid-binding Zn ribbon protein
MNSEGYGNGLVEVLVPERYHLSASKNDNLIEDSLSIIQKCQLLNQAILLIQCNV